MKKIIKNPVKMTLEFEKKSYDRMRKIAYDERRSIPNVLREALEFYLNRRNKINIARV